MLFPDLPYILVMQYVPNLSQNSKLPTSSTGHVIFMMFLMTTKKVLEAAAWNLTEIKCPGNAVVEPLLQVFHKFQLPGCKIILSNLIQVINWFSTKIWMVVIQTSLIVYSENIIMHFFKVFLKSSLQ